MAEQLRAPAPEIACDLGPDDDERTAAVGDDAAVEAVERVGDDRRREHLLDRHRVAEEGVGVVLRVQRGGDLDLGQLGARRAELVHVPSRGQRVLGGDGRSPQQLEVGFGRFAERPVAARRRPAGARLAGERDEGDVALAGRDRGRRVPDVREVGRAAELRRVGVPTTQTEVLRHRQRPEAGRFTVAEVGVDVGQGEAGIGERAERDVGVDLGERRIRDLAQRVLVHADDRRRAAQRHVSPDSVARPRTSAR